MKLEVIFHSNIEFDGDSDTEDFAMPLKVKGVSFKTGFIKNKMFIVPHEEAENIATSLGVGIDGLGAYILKDHGYKGIMLFAIKSVDNLVGRVEAGVALGNLIMYKGSISVDKDLAEKVYKRLVTSSSIGLHVGEVTCSICAREYSDKECTHIFGKEYPEEKLHETMLPYLEEMDGKHLAVPVGRKIEAREQSIVLFPAIKGASIGLNFTEESENMLDEINRRKEGNTNENTNLYQFDDKIIDKLAEIIVTLNKEDEGNMSENTMTGEFDLEKFTSEIAELKVINLTLTNDKSKLETDVAKLEGEKGTITGKVEALEGEKVTLESEVADLKGKLATATELVDEYKVSEVQRLAEEKSVMLSVLAELRKDKGMPERDYSTYSNEVILDAIATLNEIPVSIEAQGSAGEANLTGEKKEDVREVLMGYRKDGKALKGLRELR